MVHRRAQEPRSITEAGLARLLDGLAADSEKAACEYQHLHLALVRFFDWRGAAVPEELADETLDRLARRLEDDTIEDVRQFAHGIARLVLLEQRRKSHTSPLEFGERATDQAVRTIEDSPLAPCFEACLGSLSDTSRNLALEYYAAERQEKIANRRRLAAALDISESALRNRVQRIRDHLEQCTRHCVERAQGGGLSNALRHVPTVSDRND